MNQCTLNPKARSTPQYLGLFNTEEYQEVDHFLRHSAATPLFDLGALAAKAGVAQIMLKDESNRFGLNSFKTLGVSYAVARLISKGRITRGSLLACATEGNHGRAVARAARDNGLRARVYMSADASPARIRSIKEEGAQVVTVAGSYDDAVRIVADEAESAGWTIVSDTSWPGYEEIPRLIMSGYTRLMNEVASDRPPLGRSDIVLVQAGVGGLACAVVSWLCHHFGAMRPFTIVCEPTNAACLQRAARAGNPVSLDGPFDTIMAGLRCGEVSPLAWPTIAAAADAFVSIDDEWCVQAMRILARPLEQDPSVTAGASGACGLGTLLAIFGDRGLDEVRNALGIDANSSRVLVINTEGATDPDLYARVTGKTPPSA